MFLTLRATLPTQVLEQKAGLVSLDDITKRVKEEIINVKKGIIELSNLSEVDPVDIFGVVKKSKEALDNWCHDSMEALWSFELRALLRGDPVKVRIYQRTQMDIFAARFTFIKAAQKAITQGKDLIILDDPMTMRKG